jgi:hypothetical protein
MPHEPSREQPMELDCASLGPMKAGLIRLILSVEEHAKMALLEQELTPEDRAALNRAIQELKPSFVALADGVIEPFSAPSPERVDLAYELLWRFVSVVIEIVGPVVFTDSTKHIFAKVIRKEVTASQAASARAAKSIKNTESRRQLRNAILSEAGDAELVASAAFADSLVDGVKGRLSASKGTSTRTIEREIRAILEERRQR